MSSKSAIKFFNSLLLTRSGEQSFKEEYEALLREFAVEYDTRYIFDWV